ncbi:MAG: adenylate cyclase [Armatimonadetes bacterium]|nr:adenylate cyclase [Armatimonadota bacterium]
MPIISPLIPYHFFRAAWAFRYLRGDGLRRYQDARARRIIAFARARSPFYREHWHGLDERDWRDFPTIDKAAMMANFDTFNTQSITQDEAFAVALRAERERDFAPTISKGGGNITVGLSSGTSGHRGAFLVSPPETAAWAGTVLQRVLHTLPRRGYRVAFFLRSNSNLYERVGGRVRFRYFDLMTQITEQIAALNDYAPNLIVAPPSLLTALADAASRGNLRARPEKIVSVAETLEAHDKTVLETAFGVAVGQIYQCTEGFLAATCPHGRLHVNEDLVALQYEPLPGSATMPPSAKQVSPVVTDLWRRTQPIIRYRLGDILTLANAPCPCESDFQVIESVGGRCDDLCYFPDVATGEPRRFYPDTVRRMVLLADSAKQVSPVIADYAAIQTAPGNLSVHLAVTGNADFAAVETAVRVSIAQVLAQYHCRAERIEVIEGLPPTAPGAKRRRIINRGERPPEERAI